MTDFDELYSLTRDLTKNYDRAVEKVRRGESPLRRQRHSVPIVDTYTDTQYGSLTIDGTGQLFDLQLDAYEVSQSSQDHLIVIQGIRTNAAAIPVQSAIAPAALDNGGWQPRKPTGKPFGDG
ncbi:hypothetical protein [Nocardia asteroides]|uniref:hypothetical protein n=1 Tax=Nocardia asteroides TaxID=1824 RepID=UPI001E4AECCD|nr:hypothetical protein [Nocardia asteroides]UGT64746.1 hypothetical protein LTT61_16325 [Nocardia asteroides]